MYTQRHSARDDIEEKIVIQELLLRFVEPAHASPDWAVVKNTDIRRVSESYTNRGSQKVTFVPRKKPKLNRLK